MTAWLPDWLGPAEKEALLLSLKVAFWATLVSLPFGIAAAHALARGRFWGRALLDGLIQAPLILPPVVTGFLLLLAFGRNGPAGAFLENTFGLTVAFRWTGAALAAAVMAFPLMVRAMRLSLEAADPRLEEAAATLGAPPLARFVLVTLPLMAPGILAGAVLAFAKAMGEFGATIAFVASIPGETRTVPAAIYALLQTPGGEPAALRLAALSLCVALAALVASESLARAAARRIAS
ncbi:MAG: molybdate ABC transporter permease subunit [Pseudomonadota bacterium]